MSSSADKSRTQGDAANEAAAAKTAKPAAIPDDDEASPPLDAGTAHTLKSRTQGDAKSRTQGD